MLAKRQAIRYKARRFFGTVGTAHRGGRLFVRWSPSKRPSDKGRPPGKVTGGFVPG